MREADQRLELCLPVLLYCPVSESISGAGQSCVRGMPVSAIFCTVQELQEPKKKICPLYRIAKCPHLGIFLMALQSGRQVVA